MKKKTCETYCESFLQRLQQPRSQALSPFPPTTREKKERGPGNEVETSDDFKCMLT